MSRERKAKEPTVTYKTVSHFQPRQIIKQFSNEEMTSEQGPDPGREGVTLLRRQNDSRQCRLDTFKLTEGLRTSLRANLTETLHQIIKHLRILRVLSLSSFTRSPR